MKWGVGFVVWALLVGATAGYVWGADRSYVGAGMVAKELCSCVHVGARSFDACRADLPALPGIGFVRAEPLPGGDGVRAWVPGFDARVARAAPERGCTLEP